MRIIFKFRIFVRNIVFFNHFLHDWNVSHLLAWVRSNLLDQTNDLVPDVVFLQTPDWKRTERLCSKKLSGKISRMISQTIKNNLKPRKPDFLVRLTLKIWFLLNCWAQLNIAAKYLQLLDISLKFCSWIIQIIHYFPSLVLNFAGVESVDKLNELACHIK